MNGEVNNPEMDAQTLAEAAVIKADLIRLGEAKKAAGQLAKEAEIRMKSLNAIKGHIYDHPDSIKVREQRASRTV